MRWGAHHRGRAEAGSALIEVMVSAVIVVAIALATLSAIDRAQKTSSNGKIRSVAATLADQDQERLRAMKAGDLTTLGTSSRTVSSHNVSYTVTSTAAWIRDDAGVAESCADGDGSSASYIKITSTVAAPASTGTANRPVTVTSFLTPPTAVFGPNQGTLAVKVVDRAGNPVQGMTVTTSGPRALNAPTNSAGCAVFSRVPTGTYTITLNTSGWVAPNGSQSTSATQEVTTGNLNVKTMTYERAATVRVTFDTQPQGSAAVTSRGWGATAENTAPVLLTQQSSATSPQSSFDLTSMYPSDAGTRVWAGDCAAANPVSAIPNANYFSAAPGSSAAPVLTPGVVNNVVTRLPALNLRVMNGTNPVTSGDIVLLPKTAAGCAATTKIRLVPTATGWASKQASPYDPGVPFGTYDICLDNNGSSSNNGAARRRKRVLNVPVTDPINGSQVLTVDLYSGSPDTGTSATCNTNTGNTRFP